MAKRPPIVGERINKWQQDTTERLEKLQCDLDQVQATLVEVQHAQEVAQAGIDGLHVVTQKIKAIVTENNEILKGMEAAGSLSRITARFTKRTQAA